MILTLIVFPFPFLVLWQASGLAAGPIPRFLLPPLFLAFEHGQQPLPHIAAVSA